MLHVTYTDDVQPQAIIALDSHLSGHPGYLPVFDTLFTFQVSLGSLLSLNRPAMPSMSGGYKNAKWKHSGYYGSAANLRASFLQNIVRLPTFDFVGPAPKVNGENPFTAIGPNGECFVGRPVFPSNPDGTPRLPWTSRHGAYICSAQTGITRVSILATGDGYGIKHPVSWLDTCDSIALSGGFDFYEGRPIATTGFDYRFNGFQYDLRLYQLSYWGGGWLSTTCRYLWEITYHPFRPENNQAYPISTICTAYCGGWYWWNRSDGISPSREASASYCRAANSGGHGWFNKPTDGWLEWFPVNAFFIPCLSDVADIDGMLGYRDDKSGIYGSCYHNTGPDSVGFFMQDVAEFKDDAYACVVLSARAAVDKALDTCESNFIESLTEIQEVLGLFAIVDVLRALHSVNGFLEFIDLLTDIDLLWRFGIAPNISDAPNLLKAYRVRVFSSLDKTCGLTVGRTDKSNHFSYQSSRDPYFTYDVGVQSKVVLKVNPDSFLAYVTPLNQWGLLPTFSNIWDIIPYSFIADYFLSVGNKLGYADASILALCTNIEYATHSVKVRRDIRDQLSRYYISANGIASYTWYERFQTATLPAVVPSRILARSELHLPDWDLAGSLIYKLAFR